MDFNDMKLQISAFASLTAFAGEFILQNKKKPNQIIGSAIETGVLVFLNMFIKNDLLNTNHNIMLAVNALYYSLFKNKKATDAVLEATMDQAYLEVGLLAYDLLNRFVYGPREKSIDEPTELVANQVQPPVILN